MPPTAQCYGAHPPKVHSKRLPGSCDLTGCSDGRDLRIDAPGNRRENPSEFPSGIRQPPRRSRFRYLQSPPVQGIEGLRRSLVHALVEVPVEVHGGLDGRPSQRAITEMSTPAAQPEHCTRMPQYVRGAILVS